MLTVNEAAEAMGISSQAVRRLIRSGTLPAVRRRNRILVDPTSIDFYNTAVPVRATNTDLLTVPEVAGILRCCASTVHGLVHRGVLTAVRNPGRSSRMLIHRASVDAHLQPTPQ